METKTNGENSTAADAKKMPIEKTFMLVSFVGFSLWIILDTIRVLMFHREEIAGNLQFWAGYGLSTIIYYIALGLLTFTVSKKPLGKILLTIVPSILVALYLIKAIIVTIGEPFKPTLFENVIVTLFQLSMLFMLISVSITIVKFFKERAQSRSKISSEE